MVDIAVPNARFAGRESQGCGFRLDSMGEDLTVHFVQVIKKT